MTIAQDKAGTAFTCYLAGEESLLVRCAEILLDRGHRILGVFSSDPAIRRAAEGLGLPTLRLDAAGQQAMAAQSCDYFFSITNLQVLPAALVDAPRRMTINFHDGPLPAYAGLYATTWALLARATDYAITWHRVTPHGIDDGEILLQAPVAIEPGDTALALNAKCYEAAVRSFPELVAGLETGALVSRAQDLSKRTYFGRKRRPAGAGAVRWDSPAEQVVALVAALDFGPYPNPLTLPKVWHGERAWVVGRARVAETASGLGPGTVVTSAHGDMVVATAAGDVHCEAIADATGLPWAPGELELPPAGASLRRFRPADLDHWTATHEQIAAHEPFWVDRLVAADPLEPTLPELRVGNGAGSLHHVDTALSASETQSMQQRLGAPSAADTVVALVTTFLARASGVTTVSVGYTDRVLQSFVARQEALFSPWVPLQVHLPDAPTFDGTAGAVLADRAIARQRSTFARDVAGRMPRLRAKGSAGLPERWPVLLHVGEAAMMPATPTLSIGIAEDGTAISWRGSDSRALEALARQFRACIDAARFDGTRALFEYPLIDAGDRQTLLVDWNATAAPYPRDRCIHHWVEAQVARTPDGTALVAEGQAYSYRHVNARANRIACRLRGAGVAPGAVVGLALPRSADMVCAALAVLKLGAAYLPLDPDYPADRLRFMLQDSGATVVVETSSHPHPRDAGVAVVTLGAADDNAPAEPDAPNLDTPVSGSDVAYVIYTSGSTGAPKGVLVEHRNVANFFAGMDATVVHDPPGVWLAVTSLSFDISVLEVFWTLARGFTVVLQSEVRNATAGEPGAVAARRPIDVSLFYFASDEGSGGASKYQLLLDGARFADTNGFHAVWTPERHFHAFGGLYPNPSVAGAAIAAVTTRVGIRAGSVVLPLHHPIRVAEEWSLVDNLSNGRVGVSFASGWHPDDFVLRPEAFADARQSLMRDVETVRRLWRGERVGFPGPLGKDVEVATLPRPVQPQLPVWITAAGNPETFRLAGQAGYFVLTHLLGQTLEELRDKIAVYRRAWREHGHAPGGGRVTLMLHTYVGESDAGARETVRAPMKRYLGSAVSLIKQYAWSFPAFRKRTDAAGGSTDDILAQLPAEDLDGLLDHAYARYYETSGLFGTPETCLQTINRVRALGIEEIACLIDFGVPHEQVLDSLPRLARLRRLSAAMPDLDPHDQSIPAAIERHGVTHLQCTPSLAGMLVRDADARLALGRLRHLLVGGEAMPAALAAALTATLSGRLTNMYGPTETTVWSTVHEIIRDDHVVPIGRPLANTTVYVLDAHGQPVPPGMPGELYIGGDGVARGYHRRPELTVERFVPDPFARRAGARLYRTGDLVRHRRDGVLEFIGRYDSQVKIRGYRIELGEIESSAQQHPAVGEVVVVARPGPEGDPILAAYVVPRAGAAFSSDDLRTFLRARLPPQSVPTAIVTLPVLPLTPNGKVDRGRLPDPSAASDAAAAPPALPENDLERTVAQAWAEVLQVPQVGIDQNFFDLGGHSLLTLRVLGRLREATGRSLAITDMFRFPTVRALARHMAVETDDSQAMSESHDRGAARRGMMTRRRRVGA